VISEYTNETIGGGGGGVEKKCVLKGSIKCVLHINKVKLETFVNSALFCFT